MKELLKLLKNNRWTMAFATVISGILVAVGVDPASAEAILTALGVVLTAVLASERDTRNSRRSSESRGWPYNTEGIGLDSKDQKSRGRRAPER